MKEHAETNETSERQRQCHGCGTRIRQGAQFCTDCWLPLDAVTGRPSASAEPGTELRRSRRARSLTIGAAVIVVAELALGVLHVANAPDLQATKSKTGFVQLWNPFAQAYGLPTYSQGEL